MAQLSVPSGFQSNVLTLTTGFIGPWTSPALGNFDPTQSLSLYIDGNLVPVVSFSFDAAQNAYLLYTGNVFSATSTFQVCYRMPSSPFVDSNGATIPGFFAVYEGGTS